MPSVPSTKEAPVNGPACPHAAKLHNHTNGDGKLREGSLPLNGVDKKPMAVDAEESHQTIQISTKNASPERKWIRPDLPSRCKWTLGASGADSPHTQVPRSVLCRLSLETTISNQTHVSAGLNFCCEIINSSSCFVLPGTSPRPFSQTSCTGSATLPWSASTRSPRRLDSNAKYVSHPALEPRHIHRLFETFHSLTPCKQVGLCICSILQHCIIKLQQISLFCCVLFVSGQV